MTRSLDNMISILLRSAPATAGISMQLRESAVYQRIIRSVNVVPMEEGGIESLNAPTICGRRSVMMFEYHRHCKAYS